MAFGMSLLSLQTLLQTLTHFLGDRRNRP